MTVSSPAGVKRAAPIDAARDEIGVCTSATDFRRHPVAGQADSSSKAVEEEGTGLAA